ncbi:uncharacterized protein VP01_2300g2 [Puccinia sorghi]|uniref:Uncharacterized protein n=1 Tax=Puccinia sorghi TaxID=27349 RepID=A0A0L6V8M2_9BASI|nr:uncharacterized protein VP01_2300g2 [Puccinia sorghi]
MAMWFQLLPKYPPSATPSPMGQSMAGISQLPNMMAYQGPAGNFFYLPYHLAVSNPMQYMPAYALPGSHPIQACSHSMYPGVFMGAVGQLVHSHPTSLSNPILPPPPPLVNGNLGVRSSPAASEGVELNEYLHFAHVDPTDLVIQQALDNLGITHYLAFQNFKATKLEDAGIKKGHAQCLIT